MGGGLGPVYNFRGGGVGWGGGVIHRAGIDRNKAADYASLIRPTPAPPLTTPDVMAGLDSVLYVFLPTAGVRVDARATPGHDDGGGGRDSASRARGDRSGDAPAPPTSPRRTPGSICGVEDGFRLSPE